MISHSQEPYKTLHNPPSSFTNPYDPMSYELVVGLEVHAKIKSTKKLFCSCENSQDLTLKPNTHICPVCSAQP